MTDSRSLPGVLLVLFGLALPACRMDQSQQLEWESAATATKLSVALHAPSNPPAGKTPTIVYLKNLNQPRVGRDSDEAILGDFAAKGYIVAVVDYAKHAEAVSPKLNADVLKLRRDIADSKLKNFLLDQPIDPNRLFMIPEGFRLKRDIEFARDGERVLAMDVIYPANPANPVPLLMEITCDNFNRMGSFSLLYCKDTLMEGAALAGFAAAMVDHPVPPPYKGLDDPMPQSLDRMKAAVEKLRSLRTQLSHNNKIGAIGFSRGGPFAAMLAGQGDVQAALVHGNRYDYLDLRADDPMLPRFEIAWGPMQTNRENWAKHSAAAYLTERAVPMFLNTSDTESVEYRDGLAKFAALLKARGVEHVYKEDIDGRGHTVTTNVERLLEIDEFFSQHLRD